MYLGFGEFIYLLFIIYDGEKPRRLRPVLLQDYFGTGLRYYFVAGAKIVPQMGVCNRNKTSA
jgi:hypothetical protein